MVQLAYHHALEISNSKLCIPKKKESRHRNMCPTRAREVELKSFKLIGTHSQHMNHFPNRRVEGGLESFEVNRDTVGFGVEAPSANQRQFGDAVLNAAPCTVH